MTALDFETGAELWDRLVGKGSGGFWDKYSSVTAPVVIGPNGAAYVGIRTGVISVKDAQQASRFPFNNNTLDKL